MSEASVLPTRRTLAWVALAYLLLIVSLSVPRAVGSSWRSIMSPRDMRSLEGNPVQWEAFLVLRSLRAMSSNEVTEALTEWFSTDEYRATLPTYVAAIASQITGSYVIGITASEVVWWWVGALAVFVLAKSFVGTPTAFCAGLLTCASPIGMGHIGSGHLHTASSLSLSLFVTIAWQLLESDRFGLFEKAILYGSCVYLSSITYTYQWFLAPFFVVVAIIPRVSRGRLLASILGIGVFLTLRWVSYGVLALGGVEVHAHLNDPLRVIQDRLSSLSDTGGQWVAIGSFLTDTVANVVLGTVTSYHPAVVLFAAVGLVGTHDARFLVASGTAIILGFAFGAIYGVPWVLMSGYPFVYMLAAHGMTRASHAVAAHLPLLRERQYASIALLASLTVIVATLTNLDLVGDPTFAMAWWRSWYTPH